MKVIATRSYEYRVSIRAAGAVGIIIENFRQAVQAQIDGATVVVSAQGVSEPKNVRFGWHHMVNPNLSNKEGLPAGPFKTDDWKGVSGE
ncbi:MAG: hypothetical protein VCA55_07230 [Verrucomicrobiales bacterium]